MIGLFVGLYVCAEQLQPQIESKSRVEDHAQHHYLYELQAVHGLLGRSTCQEVLECRGLTIIFVNLVHVAHLMYGTHLAIGASMLEHRDDAIWLMCQEDAIGLAVLICLFQYSG